MNFIWMQNTLMYGWNFELLLYRVVIQAVQCVVEDQSSLLIHKSPVMPYCQWFDVPMWYFSLLSGTLAKSVINVLNSETCIWPCLLRNDKWAVDSIWWKSCIFSVAVSFLFRYFKQNSPIMSVWKRLQRVGKRASKYQFTASYQELSVECTKKWQVSNSINLVLLTRLTFIV